MAPGYPYIFMGALVAPTYCISLLYLGLAVLPNALMSLSQDTHFPETPTWQVVQKFVPLCKDKCQHIENVNLASSARHKLHAMKVTPLENV